MPALERLISAETLGHVRLPSNYLPAALPALCGHAAGREMSFVVTRGDAVEIVPVPAGVVRDPDALRGHLEELGGNRSGVEVDIGPPAPGRCRHVIAGDACRDDADRSEGEAGSVDRDAAADLRPAGHPELHPSGAEKAGRTVVLGLIDAGIAFWNDVFLAGERPAFADIGALTLAGGDGAPVPSPERWLGPGRVRDWSLGAPPVTRDHLARGNLGRYLQQSAFAPHDGGGPLLGAGDAAHGTAMAALLLEGQARAGRGDSVPMLGLELPQWILADSTGSLLTAALDLAVRVLVGRARALGATHVVILAAFAHTGPSGVRPAALTRLGETMRLFAARGVKVEVVVPVGNHLRDRIHARVDDAASYGGPRLSWQVVRDDHSVNTIDVVLPDTRQAGIEILPPGDPGGPPASATLEPGGVWLLKEGGSTIGAVWADELPDGRLRVRVSIAGTAAAAGATRPARAAAGAWGVGFPGHESLEAWVLRDDAPFDDARLPPRRQSWIADPLYRMRASIGVPAIADPAAPRGPVRRHGTISPLAAAPLTPVTARWAGIAPPPGGPAPYAGLAADGGAGGPALVVDRPGPGAGIAVVAGGSPRLHRISGTSAAAALAAGMRAADLAS